MKPCLAPRPAVLQGGFAMLLVLFAVVVVSGLSFGLLQEGMAARNSIVNHKDNFRALEVAESGLVRAEMELRAQVDLDGGGIGASEGSFANGSYAVTVTDDPVSADRWILRARGEHGLSVRRIEVGVRRRVGSSYADALFSVGTLPLSNVTTDAYDSRVGTYASQATNADAAGSYAQPGGSVGSNGDIELDGTTVWVRGNAIPGPGQEVVISGSPTVTGDMAPRTFALEMDPAPYADFEAALNDNDNQSLTHGGNGNRVRYNAANYSLEVAGNTSVTMKAGTYFFRDFSMKGGSTLNVTGPVTIYVTGSVDIGAGANIVASQPADVQLIVHPYALPTNRPAPSEALVKVNGGSQVTWTMYGPGASLDIGGGNHFYGAAVGQVVELQGNNTFHYDKALGATVRLSVATLERLYWREVTPPRR